MDVEEFRRRGKEMIDYAADYLENIRNRKPLSQVKPGYLMDLLPDEAPKEGEKWDDIVADIERTIMPGLSHWQSPYFHAYFVSGNSYPAMIANILCDALSSIGFSWIASPASTELEMLMMKWLGKMIKLPVEFYEGEEGGGVIQGSASESLYVSLLAARTKALKEHPNQNNYANLVMYCSEQAHTSCEKAGLIALVKCRKIQTDEKYRMDAKLLHDAIMEDRNNGLVPFFCVATLGTTSNCSFDNLKDIGPICNKERIWLHIDAAYAGSAFICPEFRYLMDGVQYSDSFNFSPHKWLSINHDCSALWLVEKTEYLIDGFHIDASYLKYKASVKVRDYRHWQIHFGRRFRSLKMWFVFRSFGTKGLQDKIRKDVLLAKKFESFVTSHTYFEIVNETIMGLVCFRLKGTNKNTELLMENLNEDGRIFLISGMVKGIYYLRFSICGPTTTVEDIEYSWNVIMENASSIINST